MRDVREWTEFGLAVGRIEKIHGNVPVVTTNPRLAERHGNDIPATLLKQVSQHVAAGQAGGTCDKCGTLCLRHLSSLLYVTPAEIRAATTLRTTRPRAQAHAPSKPARRGGLADLVDTVRVKGDVILDLHHRFKRGLIRPHCVAGTITARRNAVVGSVALVGAVRGVFAARERGHIDVPAADVLNGRIGRLAQCQRVACVCDNFSADFDHDARPVRFNRNGVVGSRNLYRLVGHDLHPSELETVPGHPETVVGYFRDQSAKLSPNIGRPLFDSARAASSWTTSQCSANTPLAMRTTSAAIQFLGRPVPENRPWTMTKSPSATITPGSYLRDAGVPLMRLKRPSRPGSMCALC